MTNIQPIAPLTGKKLIKKVKQLENFSQKEKAFQCGYYTETKNGVKRVKLTAFQKALLTATNINVDQCPQPKKKSGRHAIYKVSVQQNYNILINPAYTKQLDVEPGTIFEVIVGKKYITLKKIEYDNKENKN